MFNAQPIGTVVSRQLRERLGEREEGLCVFVSQALYVLLCVCVCVHPLVCVCGIVIRDVNLPLFGGILSFFFFFLDNPLF